MFIHFAFSPLRDNPDKQLDRAMETIFDDKRLLFGKNPEFIPRINPKVFFKNVHRVVSRSIDKRADSTDIQIENRDEPFNKLFSLMRENVKMVCFIETELSELAGSTHTKYYGKLGIVLTNKFLLDSNIHQVQYYTEHDLIDDELVRKWNFNYAYRSDLTENERKEKRALEIEMLAYRKPAYMFESFESAEIINITKGQVEKVYSGYDIGYNFQNENEWRIVSSHKQYLNFTESDVSLVLVPNNKARKRILNYFDTNWDISPKVMICP